MKDKHTLFITGIGTDVGKTIVSAILTEALQADYWKPIQAGETDGKTDLDTVKYLVSNKKSTFHHSYYNLATPVSPHLAAKIDGVVIKKSHLVYPKTENYLIIEGAGGLLVPINKKNVVANVINKKNPVVLVSKNYLGSINHTLLSIYYLKAMGYKKIGILFNGEENKASEKIIKKMGKVKIIGRINQLKELTKEEISLEAENIKPKLLRFLGKV